MPELIVDVDILTGEKTVMQYLLKPFIRGASESFRRNNKHIKGSQRSSSLAFPQD